MAAMSVKQEPGTEDDIGQRILTLCQSNPGGISTEDLNADCVLSRYTNLQLLPVLNALSSARKIIVKTKKGKPVYCLPGSSATKTGGDDIQEKVAYQIIAESGNKGIWIREIRTKTSLTTTELNKVLKSLESKKLIKALKNVNATKKKMYILYDVKPDSSVTGGAWFSENKFDSEFSNLLNQFCLRCLELKAMAAKEMYTDPTSQLNGALATVEEVHHYITSLRVSTIELTTDEIESVLNTLVYDGRVKEVRYRGASGSGDGDQKLYRLQRPLMKASELVTVPCGICPVIDKCSDIGAITPAKCVYMKEWLEKVQF